jgi:hypothetical protein
MEKPPMIVEEVKFDIFLTITYRCVKELTIVGSHYQVHGVGVGVVWFPLYLSICSG